jgi:hypothetical protein
MENSRNRGPRGLRLAVIATVALAVGGAYGQSINGVSTNPSHGSPLTISGTSFGTKPSPAPLKWENFESGTPGSVITTSQGWDAVDGWDGSGHNHRPFYDQAVKHAGSQGMTCPFVSNTYNSSLLKYADFANGFYFDAWYRYAPANPASRNNKLFIVYGSNSDMPQVHYASWCDLNGPVVFDTRATTSAGTMTYSNLVENTLVGGELKHLQVWMKPSSAGVADGILWAACNGVVTANRSDVLTYVAGGGVWNSIRLGYYVAHDGVANCAASGDAHAYWDDVYFDNTQARVELGNAATYSACTHREIQIPSSWSPSEVTVTFNQGTFVAGDTPYLFVVTAAGAISPGFRVTIGGTAPTAPGQPGKPVF